MVDESSHNNPQDIAKEKFLRSEEQVIDISRNMALLMGALANTFGPFEEVSGSNSKVGFDKKLGDSEDPKKG
jgi:hypothetical protein